MTSKTILVTWIVGLFTVSVSGIVITVCPSQIPGASCQLICESADFSQTVTFRKDGSSIGICVAGGACFSTAVDYVDPQRIGTNQTVLNISAYSIIRDPGEWLCSAGVSVSPSKTMYYAIPPTSATITPNNFTVNSTTQIIVTTDCAYINISGIIQFKDSTYSQSNICTEVSSGGCASGTGEKYTCPFILNTGDMATGTYELEFRVDLPYDNTNPNVNLTSTVYVTFPESLTTTATSNAIHYTDTTPTQIKHTNRTSNNTLGAGEILGIALGVLIVLSTVIVCIIIIKKRSGQMKNKK